MSIFQEFKESYDLRKNTEMSLLEYLELCKTDSSAYATAAERMLKAIGEPEVIDTSTTKDRLSRLFMNRTIRVYPSFSSFYGMEDTIEQIVGYFNNAAQGLEEKKQILYLLGPVGSAKSSIAERLKELMETQPIYVLKAGDQISPVFETPLGLFEPGAWGDKIETEYGIPRRYLNGKLSPWAVKRLNEDFEGDISQFKVVKIYPSKLNQIGITKTEPGDENNQDISSLVGKVDISKLGLGLPQDDPDCYRYSGGLCRSNQGLLEFVEMFKAPIKVLHPLLTATQEGNYNGTEAISGIPFSGLVLAHSNEAEWQTFRNNKNNEAFLDRVYIVKVPYCLRVDEEVKIYNKMLDDSKLKTVNCAPQTKEMLAKLCVLSRLVQPQNSNIISKMRVYNGESLKDTDMNAKSYQDYRDEAGVDEGMSGLSTRWAFKRLSKVYNYDPKSLGANPVYLMRVVEDSIEKEQFPEDKEMFLFEMLKELKTKYVEYLEKEIRIAYLESYSAFGQNLFDKYINYAEHWIEDQDYKDPASGEMFDRDYLNKQLEEIERPAGINNVKEFRNEVTRFALRHRGKKENLGQNPVWTSYEKLREVIEKKMFANTEDLIPVITFDEKSSKENEEKHQGFLARMIEKGYTAHDTKVCVEWWMRMRKAA